MDEYLILLWSRRKLVDLSSEASSQPKAVHRSRVRAAYCLMIAS